MLGWRLFSLGKPRWRTLVLYGLIFVVWLIAFLFSDLMPLLWTLVAAQHLFLIGVWAYFIWQFTRPDKRIVSRVTLLRPVILFTITVLAMSALHATILRSDAASFNGVPAGTTPIGEWGIGIFLAIETMATLGSGTIPARTAASLTSVAYNCVASLAYGLVAISLAMMVIATRVSQSKS